MQYYKIVQTATECERLQSKVNEYFRLIGANPHFEKTVLDALYKSINVISKDLARNQTKLKKLIS